MVGVVHGSFKNTKGAYIATGYAAIADFLASAGISTAAAAATSAVIPNVPGAFHILFTCGNVSFSPAQEQVRNAIDAHILARIESLFPGATFTQIDGMPSDGQDATTLCMENGAIGLLIVGEG